jgi:2'-5' RNA ligase
LSAFRKMLSEHIVGSYLIAKGMRSYAPHLTLARIDTRQDRVQAYLP